MDKVINILVEKLKPNLHHKNNKWQISNKRYLECQELHFQVYESFQKKAVEISIQKEAKL